MKWHFVNKNMYYEAIPAFVKTKNAILNGYISDRRST